MEGGEVMTRDRIQTVVLKTTNDEYELNMIKEILDDNKIPYIIKDHGAGGYMRIIGGSSFYGTDILVEISDFEKAEFILSQFPFK